MKLEQLSLPSPFVKKSNDFVRSRVNFNNVLSGRILASFISLIDKSDVDFKEYAIPATSVLVKGTGGKAYQELKESCRILANALVERKMSGVDSFSFSPIFMKIGYDHGIIYGKFSPEIKDLLLQYKGRFTQYNLTEYMQMQSAYSQRMFEIVKSYASMKIMVVEIEDLHRMLDTPPSLRKSFKDFRVRVLDRAHADINGSTSVHFYWEPIYIKRKVRRIKFIFDNSMSGKLLPETTTSIDNPIVIDDCSFCWSEKKRLSEPCAVRLTKNHKGIEKCQQCLMKYPVDNFGA